ncbi:Fe-S oxidoreductase-like protein in Rubrerythrin cluster [Burkholderia singularis]|uniref:Fe-S oxidoreductase-like protein in Rubrerythrin cluster n=1 Tax=Burkholderia singularis TaxID=1503053 RepID=A0A238H2C0_9BURK|nr:Fe-S oxidoreductase-like protein in Rubrerythrin cluster [Burkholderia singularis]
MNSSRAARVAEYRCPLEQVNLEIVAKKKAVNIPALADYPRAGYVLMYKSELPPMFPDDPDIHTLADAFWSPFE